MSWLAEHEETNEKANYLVDQELIPTDLKPCVVNTLDSQNFLNIVTCHIKIFHYKPNQLNQPGIKLNLSLQHNL